MIEGKNKVNYFLTKGQAALVRVLSRENRITQIRLSPKLLEANTRDKK